MKTPHPSHSPITMKLYWIVEHASYGTLMCFEDLKPRFAWSGYRHESMLFYSEETALDALRMCWESGRRGMQKAYILKHVPFKGYYDQEGYNR